MRQRILRLAADLVALGHLLGGLPHGETGGVLGHGGRHRQQIFDPQLAQNIETLLQIARLVEIHQGASQLLAHPMGSTDEESAPPAMAMSTVPAMMDSVTLATAWKLVAQARDTL